MRIYDFRCECGKEFEVLTAKYLGFGETLPSICCKDLTASRIPSVIRHNFLNSYERYMHSSGTLIKEAGLERDARRRREEKEERRLQNIQNVVTEVVMQYDLPE